MKKLIFICITLSIALSINLQAQNKLVVNADQGKHTISKHIYGHFAEHLGHCIYGGFWVGEQSSIPNTRGIRNDVVKALKDLNIPNLRWPGGCFADEYHWMDGIGPRNGRPKMINTHWGGVTEDNSFGTHEFLDLCEELGTEPYICGNVGSGTVEEMSKWVEYITSDAESPMTDLRRENGREKPWRVKYWGVGNENWGCGGNMTAEYYAGEYRRYATYCRNYSGNHLYKVSGGPYGDDFHWTEVLMKAAGGMHQGMSIHKYTGSDPKNDKEGYADVFSDEEYYRNVFNTYTMDETLARQSTIMDRYDPGKGIGLIVDEWGNWYKVQPGTNPGFLYQQNSLRDAITAAIHFNIFHSHCDRVHMANIAQLVNVLQALFLTEGEKMLLTPTYHAFDMYKVHQEAKMLPVNLDTPELRDGGNRPFKQVSASASVNSDGVIHISLVNTHLDNAIEVECTLNAGHKLVKNGGQIITSGNIQDHNTFDAPDKVALKDFSDFSVKDNKITVKLPAKSVVTVALK